MLRRRLLASERSSARGRSSTRSAYAPPVRIRRVLTAVDAACARPLEGARPREEPARRRALGRGARRADALAARTGRRRRPGGRRRADHGGDCRASIRRLRRLGDDRGLAWNDALAAATARGRDEPLVAVDLGRPAAARQPPRSRSCSRRRPRAGSRSPARSTAARTRSRCGPPGLVHTHFGEPRSAAVHAGLGVDHVVLDLPGLAFDVDTPGDLARMQAACL